LGSNDTCEIAEAIDSKHQGSFAGLWRISRKPCHGQRCGDVAAEEEDAEPGVFGAVAVDCDGNDEADQSDREAAQNVVASFLAVQKSVLGKDCSMVDVITDDLNSERIGRGLPLRRHKVEPTSGSVSIAICLWRLFQRTKFASIEEYPKPLTTRGKKTENACPGTLAKMLKNNTYHSFQSFPVSTTSRFVKVSFSTPLSEYWCWM
jgi:hypothetical protein